MKSGRHTREQRGARAYMPDSGDPRLWIGILLVNMIPRGIPHAFGKDLELWGRAVRVCWEHLFMRVDDP